MQVNAIRVSFRFSACCIDGQVDYTRVPVVFIEDQQRSLIVQNIEALAKLFTCT